MPKRYCKKCDGEFVPKVAPQKYCTPACARACEKKRPILKQAPKNCAKCGKEFVPSASIQKYCQEPCPKDNKIELFLNRTGQGRKPGVRYSQNVDHLFSSKKLDYLFK